jgi:methionyl-tRNA formyltransferase
MKLNFSPVKEFAMSHGFAVYQPTTLKDGKAADYIRELKCDLIALVAYGKILPNEILDIPPLGCVNIHGSLLPKYRGSSPIQRAIINGDKETGVTSQYISEETDAGDVILSKKTLIGENETSADLFDRLSVLGAELLSETVLAISQGTVVRKPQNPDEVTYAPMISKDMSPIDWKKSAYEIKCMVRGLIPWPTATMEFFGNILKVFAVDIGGVIGGMEPGSLISCGKHGIEIACIDGSVIVKEVQAPGGKRMSSAEYLRGRKIEL